MLILENKKIKFSIEIALRAPNYGILNLNSDFQCINCERRPSLSTQNLSMLYVLSLLLVCLNLIYVTIIGQSRWKSTAT
jgi:hypothetical protein